MTTRNFLLNYLEACANGGLGPAECGPMWQLGVIAALLVVAITVLLVLRWRARSQPRQA
jgi:hypothetical protein